jgi:hypothetical protein
MSEVLISVIIPTYNRADLLPRAIASVLAQHGVAAQIIVVDDGSTDDTRQVVAQFPEAAYYYQPNRGQAAARNLGLRHATGTFVASLDSDDYWAPTFLHTGLACLNRNSLDFVFLNWANDNHRPNYFDQMMSGLQLSHCRQRTDTHWFLLDAAQVRQLFVELCPAPSSSLVVRRASLVGGWNEEMLIADDWCLVLDMVINRPIRAAFTMQPHWTKYVQADNVYDGRAQLEIIERLGFHDERLLAQRFAGQLSEAEKTIMSRRMAHYYFEYGYYQWKSKGAHRVVVQGLARALWMAPLHTSKYAASMAARYVWVRLGRLVGRSSSGPELLTSGPELLNRRPDPGPEDDRQKVSHVA